MKRILIYLVMMISPALVVAQRIVTGEVVDSKTGEPVAGAGVMLADSSRTVIADSTGKFSISITGNHKLVVTAAGYERKMIAAGATGQLIVLLSVAEKEIEGVVITGTLRPVKRTESPVAVEVYTPQFFKKNPSPSIFESLQQVNGVRPQLNCSVCNTGDIHINGLEGPYTMITIDGMPVVGSLASVYGLFGIPTQLIERVEIIKGPASGLYGPEAIGGLINIITRSPEKAPVFAGSFITTSWLEHNLDLGIKTRIGKKITSLTGLHYFNYQHPSDRNNDQFTDVTLQHRVSVFNRLRMARKHNRTTSLAARYFYEDRWGGDLRWNKTFRGSDSIYGESIYTKRWELTGQYQLPLPEKLNFSFSATDHDQNSYYGNIFYRGKQKIAFGQLVWDKQAGTSHSLLVGTAVRYTYYDDNSTATTDTISQANRPEQYVVPGLFIQDEWKLNDNHLLLSGIRIDHHPIHKTIITPRLAWKWSLKKNHIIRLNAGTGFRVVNLFTEDHAALTGARAVEIKETLDPEKSFNVNMNYVKQYRWKDVSLNVDASAWYSYFINQIIADYDTDPNKIIYQNLDGNAVSRGLTMNLEFDVAHRFKSLVGFTLQRVTKNTIDERGMKISQLPVLTEKWSGTWALTYTFPAIRFTIDYTGNIYGPMRLPLLSATDPRPAWSPVWSIQNIQLTKQLNRKFECFGGVKNLLNWTPARNTPFIIARSHDPFDRKVEYDAAGNIKATAENPYALSFDPSYVYAPNQGLRVFAGIRFTIRD